MIAQIKDKINAIRLNYNFEKRKKVIAAQIDPTKIAHLVPTVSCKHEWYGNSYGGFYINPTLLNKDAIVYSIGIGKDISFDKTCIKNHGCKVYGFDPTPKSINYIKRTNTSPLFHFYEYGIDTKSGKVRFYLPANPKGTSGSLVQGGEVDSENFIEVNMKSFEDMTNALGHQHIDVLKMDIEGAEYAVLEKILDSAVTIDQILVEFHDRMYDTENTKSKAILQQLNAKGYEIFASSSTFEEISLIHKRKL